MAGLFITGTDTSTGKTVIAAGLAGALRHMGYSVGVMKPVQSGAAVRDGKRYSQDAELMVKAAGPHDEDTLTCPVLLQEPLAPAVAAEMEGRSVNIELIKSAYMELTRRHEFVIVEGAGGIAVPVKNRFLISDLIACLGLPAIIVARPGLGTINHTVLTAEHAKNRKIPVIGVIINNYRGGIVEETNPKMIEELTGVPVLGVVPHDPTICAESGELGNIISLVQEHVNIRKITHYFL